MSIPPAVGFGISATAALGVAKLTAGAAAEFAEHSAEAVSNFAEIFGGDAGAAQTAETPANADGTSASDSLQKVIDDLMNQLGLTSASPVELRLDDQGQIQVTTANPETSSPADAAARTQLQSVINQNEDLQQTIASYLS